jgi:hypothetical protein
MTLTAAPTKYTARLRLREPEKSDGDPFTGWVMTGSARMAYLGGNSSTDDAWPGPKPGWHLFDGHAGHGPACEAALEVRRWPQQAMQLWPLISMKAPDNRRSRTVADRPGAMIERAHLSDDNKVLIYRHPAEVAA